MSITYRIVLCYLYILNKIFIFYNLNACLLYFIWMLIYHLYIWFIVLLKESIILIYLIYECSFANDIPNIHDMSVDKPLENLENRITKKLEIRFQIFAIFPKLKSYWYICKYGKYFSYTLQIRIYHYIITHCLSG